MKRPSHSQQHIIWEQEHASPNVLPQMDSDQPSSGVKLFWEWLSKQNLTTPITGLEMGCGKGRNTIWLAQQGAQMRAFDFSSVAIAEAKHRASRVEGCGAKDAFIVHDAAIRWPFEEHSFDFCIDCFASTDFESLDVREFARDEFARVLKPGGFLFVYTLSTEDHFHRMLIERSPGPERNSLLHPESGKFEKVFDDQELSEFYKAWNTAQKRRIEKSAVFKQVSYPCRHYWLVLTR